MHFHTRRHKHADTDTQTNRPEDTTETISSRINIAVDSGRCRQGYRYKEKELDKAGTSTHLCFSWIEIEMPTHVVHSKNVVLRFNGITFHVQPRQITNPWLVWRDVSDGFGFLKIEVDLREVDRFQARQSDRAFARDFQKSCSAVNHEIDSPDSVPVPSYLHRGYVEEQSIHHLLVQKSYYNII